MSQENEVATCMKDFVSNCPLAFSAYEFLLHYMTHSSGRLDLNKYIYICIERDFSIMWLEVTYPDTIMYLKKDKTFIYTYMQRYE